jgi:predicted negative regulator of RcsB-dependent stress response
MNKQSAFDKKQIETIDNARSDIWEELNLPPGAISFLRQYGKLLLIGVIALTMLIVGWSLYGNHTEKRQEQAAVLLAEAILEPAGERRNELLRAVESQYGGTNAAIWSRVHLAHGAQEAGETEAAIAAYQSVLKELNAGNPLVPLIRYSMAKSYEVSGELDQALYHYQQLASVSGFTTQGLLAAGRIHELLNQPAEALQVYEQLAGLGEGQENWFVENKVASLREQLSSQE